MAKSFAIDGNGLNLIFSGSDTTYVNPYCKKDSPSKSSEAKFSQNDNTSVEIITLSGHCTTPFQFELFTWESYYSDLIAVFDEQFTSRLSDRYLDSVSPPPRLA